MEGELTNVNHADYVGKTLGDLVKDTPDYALNFYRVYCKGKCCTELKNVLHDEKLLKREIKEIKTWHVSYDYEIILN